MSEYRIERRWDDGAEVWVVTSPDVPGLVTTGANDDEIAHKLSIIIPGLMRSS